MRLGRGQPNRPRIIWIPRVPDGTIPPPPPPPPPGTFPASTSVALASYHLEAAWSAYATGLFTIGFSEIEGPDVLGYSPFDSTFGGTYDVLTPNLRTAHLERGRDTTRTSVQAGAATFTVRDTTGIFNPENTASPLYGTLAERRQPIRFGATFGGVLYPQFFGFVDKLTWEPSHRVPGAGLLTLECLDLLVWLDESSPILGSIGPTTVGAVIGRILDSIGWVDPSARSLSSGTEIPDFEADGSKTALSIISELLDVDRGVFYVDAAGRAVFEDRHARVLRTPSATIANEMRIINPGIEQRLRQNRVTVTRTQNDYTAIATDADSLQRIGPRDLATLSTPYLAADSDADGLATYILSQVSDPRPPIRELAIDNRTPELLTQCLGRELVDVVTVSAVGANIDPVDYHIERITTDVGSDRSHKTSWMLSKTRQTTSNRPFTIGLSSIVADGSTSGDRIQF